ncbi:MULTISPECIES: type III pantothenate kinase [unclassified Nocardioides]|uniref:type III pantothenate kinase n=1 Tax=unclassified Nocardioides TaxID=2615069 RepID=UPI0006F56A24|nr:MULTISPECIES: type III pantothenate kinase [unclassified Nocardioides]KRA29962.1 type III pantothenate kinase [Nocardioides sp. Root614]KRA86883.1 type III pantothenate kinase [Nocardioides sp. Root682]
MSLLAADIGNAHTVLGLLEDGDVVADWRVSTDERRTADEWSVLIRGLLGDLEQDVTGIVVCSTVPAGLNAWREMLAAHFPDVAQVIVEPGIRTGVPIMVDNPREVGTDRIINALSAAADYSGPAIVVDFGGTATTFDVVDAQGRYVGGAITPGIEISLDALSRGGAQLRMVELVRPRGVIGKNTVEALQSGMVFGVASQVEGMVGRLIAALGCATDDVAVIATGHLAPLVFEECRCFTDHSPWLTLRGLEKVFLRNQR